VRVERVGGSGFLGSAVRSRLVTEGHDVKEMKEPYFFTSPNPVRNAAFMVAHVQKRARIGTLLHTISSCTCNTVPTAGGADREMKSARRFESDRDF
jgi:nucleoside-diphosphate-sugar epimerase